MEKFTIGMDIRDVVTVANMNEIADAVNRTKEFGKPFPGQTVANRGSRVGEIRIKNNRSVTLDQYSAVSLYNAELTPYNCDEFAYETPTFIGGTVTAADKPFAILLEPANYGDLVRALISGVTPAKITMRSAGHQYAQPVVGSATGALESCEIGSARILWRGGDSGEQWCILQLGLVVPDVSVKGPVAVTLEGGTSIKVWDSSGGEGAGVVTIGSYSTRVAATTFPIQTGEIYLDVNYIGGGTVSAYAINIAISSRTPSPSTFQQYILRLGGCTVTGGTVASVYQTRAPGDIEVLGRWTL